MMFIIYTFFYVQISIETVMFLIKEKFILVLISNRKKNIIQQEKCLKNVPSWLNLFVTFFLDRFSL